MRPRLPLVAAALAAAALVVATVWLCSRAAGGGKRAPGPFPDATVVLISIDTLRADRLPVYGYAAGRTPAIDALAGDGIVFEDVYSHCPLTLPAHASLFTGLIPPRHGVRDNAGFILDARHSTLAERFRAAGMETGAAVSAYVLRGATGIAQGFDWYEDAIETDASTEALGNQQRDGSVAVDALAGWVAARAGKRVFAFLHLYEPHSPWSPPPAHRGLPTPYDGEVAYADELVGRFVERLRGTGVLDRAVVVLTADHGEGLGDHGEEEHGLFVYREAVRVPLIVRLPRAARRGTRVAGVVALADIPATILDLAGLSVEGMDGLSRRGALAGGRVEPRPVYSETLFPRFHFGWSELLAVTDGRLRYVHAPRPELFDVVADPGERTNLAGQRPAALPSMVAWLQARAGSGIPPDPAPVPPDVRERLEALGYVGGTPPASPAAGPLPDPKDHVTTYEDFREANVLRHAGRDAEAVGVLERLLARSPGMVDAREALGRTLFRLGRTAEAVAALERVLEQQPDRSSTHLTLARLHAATGRRDLVERHAARAAARQPGEAYEILAQASLAAGRPDEAVAFAHHAVEADPARAVAHYVIGLVARQRGRCDEALPWLTRAHEARERQRALVIPGLYASRGDCLARLGREDEAERAFQDEIRMLPFSVEGRMGLAILYRAQGRLAAAREAIAGVVTAHPRPGPGEYGSVIRSLRGLEDPEGAAYWLEKARARFPTDARFQTVK